MMNGDKGNFLRRVGWDGVEVGEGTKVFDKQNDLFL